MSRYTTTTAMAVSLTALCAFAVPANADCVEGGDTDNPTLTCTGSDGAPIDDDTNNLVVTVESEAELVDDDRPVELTGANQFLDNLGLIESVNDDAVRGKGANLRVDNAGTIRGGDRGIRLQDGADGFTLNNLAGGEIFAVEQAVRLDNDDALENASITNNGLIQSTNGRAIQSRGPGTTITNTGILRGGEEVVEGREGFTLKNTGTIAIRGLSWDASTQDWTNDNAPEDEDGVQFASGRADNYGVILGTDDGIDIDEGLIHNHATGVIVSTGAFEEPSNGGSGIDVDETFGPTVGESGPAGPLRIINEGYIEGVRAIGTDSDSTAEITVENSGTLRGRSGTAIELAPGQGNSSLTLSGDSAIFGDVIFGGGNDVLTVGDVTSGPLINSVFDGGGGDNTVRFTDLALGDITSARFASDFIRLAFDAGGSEISGDFRNFGLWEFGDDDVRTTSQLLAELPQATPIPLPAGLPMLITALGGLAWLRRRTGRA